MGDESAFDEGGGVGIANGIAGLVADRGEIIVAGEVGVLELGNRGELGWDTEKDGFFTTNERAAPFDG